MVLGEYIPERVLPVMLEQLCRELELDYQAYSDGWLLRIANSNQSVFIFGYTFPLNSSSAAEVAKDKVATFQVLRGQNIRAVPHFLLRPAVDESLTEELVDNTIPSDAWPVVVKPLEGSSGKFVHAVDDARSLYVQMADRSDIIWTAAPLVQSKSEIRVVILDGEVQLMYRKVPPADEPTDMPVYNLGLGAQAQVLEPLGKSYVQLAKMAQQAVQAMQLRIAAVDIFQLTDGSYSILEVNASITFEHFARQSSENWRLAKHCYKSILEKVFLGCP